MKVYPGLERLQDYAGLAEEDRQLYAFRHPGLFNPEVFVALAPQLAALPQDQRVLLESAARDLSNLSNKLQRGQSSYRLGHGPIEILNKRCGSGEIAAEYALQLAGSEEVVSEISPLYAAVLTRYTTQQAQQGQWRPVITLQELLLTAVEHLPKTPETKETRQYVLLDWIEIVKEALVDLPDGRYYTHAMHAGETMLAAIQDESDRFYLGRLNYRLGILHLDPYVRNRTPDNYDLQIQHWHQSLNQITSAENVEYLAGMLPKPLEALKKAEAYLRQSVIFSDGDWKGRSLKALAQTLEWQQVVGLPLKQKDLLQACNEALQYLDQRTSAQYRTAVVAMLHRIDEKNLNSAEDFFNTPVETMTQQYGGVAAIELITQSIAMHIETMPERCLEKMIEARQLVNEYGNVSVRKARLTLLIAILHRIARQDMPAIKPGVNLMNVVKEFDLQSQKNHWGSFRLATDLFSLALLTTQIDQEATGIKLLDTLQQIDSGSFVNSLGDVLSYSYASLYMNAAVNAMNTGNLRDSLEKYWEALLYFGELAFPDEVTDMLSRIDDVTVRSGIDNVVANMTIVRLSSLSFKLEALLGEAAVEWIQRLCQHAVLALDPAGMQPEYLNVAMQVAKGLRLHASLRINHRYNHDQDELGKQMLDKIKEAEIALGGPAFKFAEEHRVFDQNVLLSTAISSRERQAGDQALERLENLQLSFDRHLNQTILGVNEIRWNDLLHIPAIQSALDERTVLLNYYHLPPGQDWIAKTYVLVLTREHIRLAGLEHQTPYVSTDVSVGEKVAKVGPSDVVVASVREQLQMDPGPWPVTRKAGELLTSCLDEYVGGLLDVLEHYRNAGKDHLCIVPHGAFHFFPFHLLGEVGKPLADQWKITYLPNLALINRIARRPDQGNLNPIVAVGLGFENENPFGLAPLENAVAEAEKIAAIFNCAPLPEKQASSKAVIQALEHARRAHIFTHGLHNLSGAAFQCIFLAPDNGNDGRLFAYEVLGANLNQLELLTLSACETALGRFDQADNLHGLPAAFLLAGVRTIVGTLWPVATLPAEKFFTTFYQQLMQSASVLDAFYTAQQATRTEFTQYIDWGPFYLIGGW